MLHFWFWVGVGWEGALHFWFCWGGGEGGGVTFLVLSWEVGSEGVLHFPSTCPEQWVSFKEGSGIQVACLQPVQRRRLILFISPNHIQFSSNGQDTSIISAVFSKIL